MLETPGSRAAVPSRDAWNRWRSRFLLLIADPDQDVADELASELARHHVDVEVCIGAADALVAAGTLQPDAVLVAAEPGDLTGAEVVQVLAKRTNIPFADRHRRWPGRPGGGGTCLRCHRLHCASDSATIRRTPTSSRPSEASAIA